MSVGGGVFSVVLIMARPAAEGVLVTGKHAECVLVTGLGKLGVVALGGKASEAEEEDFLADPFPEGVTALEAPAARIRPLVESPVK